MIYEKVLVVTKPEPDDLTNEVCEKVVNFCKDNDIRWTFYPATYGYDTTNVLVVAIGGDGTMLSAMRESLRYQDSLVWGINTGTLGFLSGERTDNIITTLINIGRNFGKIEERMALTARVYVDGSLWVNDAVALNEIVLAPMTIQSPLTTEVYINDKFVSKQQGSGVLVSTSTGSTAMSLSAGGAIVSPSTNIMQIVPIMAHTLTSRPVITTGRDTITLKAKLPVNRNAVEVYADGRVLESAYPDDGEEIEIKIAKNEDVVKVYRPENWDFFNVLRDKMKW